MHSSELQMGGTPNSEYKIQSCKPSFHEKVQKVRIKSPISRKMGPEQGNCLILKVTLRFLSSTSENHGRNKQN